MTVRFVWKPITSWPREQTKNRETSPFRGKVDGDRWQRREIGWTDTQVDLERELRQLNVREVVVQLALTDRDIRIDGEIRANAKLTHPGVIVTFTAPGKGVLTFACDKWTTWQANIRGIAKGLEALRLLDRYGITTTGEQYVGWHELMPGHPTEAPLEDSDIAIPLHNREGEVVAEALIDVEDAALADKPWYRLSSGYVVRTEIRDEKKEMVYLHREILGLGAGNATEGDHIDRNPLNNRRSNLRLADRAQQNQNRGANQSNPWGRGVRFRAKDGKWEAMAKIEGKQHYLGLYADPMQAAEAAAAFRASHMPRSIDAELRGMTIEQAARIVVGWVSGAHDLATNARTAVEDDDYRRYAYRQALKHLHPDAGGNDSDAFLRLQQAIKVLDENDGAP